MDKILKIVKLENEPSDFDYWGGKSASERLEAIEFLRQQYIKFNKNLNPEFQRVCRVIRKNNNNE